MKKKYHLTTFFLLVLVGSLLCLNGSDAPKDSNGNSVFSFSEPEKLTPEYPSFKDLAIINDKLAFTVESDGKNFVVYDSNEYGKAFDAAYNPKDLNNKLSYFAYKKDAEGNTNHYIVYEGSEVAYQVKATESEILKENVDESQESLWSSQKGMVDSGLGANGRETYIRKKGTKFDNVYVYIDKDGEMEHLSMDSKTITPSYYKIVHPTIIDKNLYYFASTTKDLKYALYRIEIK